MTPMLPSFPSGAIAGEYGCQKSPVALQKSPISLQKNFISLQKSPVSLQKSRLSLRKSPPSTPRHPREHSLRRQLGILWVSKEPHISAKETCIPAKETHTLRHAQTEPLQKRHTPTAAGALLRGIRYYACQKSPISLPKSPVSFQKRRDAYGCL